MKFNWKLGTAMKMAGVSRTELAEAIGKNKASVSMYLNGKVTPPAKVRVKIAEVLNVSADYFNDDDPASLIENKGTIGQIRTSTAGKLMGMGHVAIEEGLKQGVFPWGYAIETSEGRYRYFINAKRFAEIEGVELPPEVVI